MLVRLTPHPDTPSTVLERIEVEVQRAGDLGLTLTYRAFGDPDRLRLPENGAEDAGRADELWRHTCFEAFVKEVGREDYLELNFAPFTQWASYRFSGYRDGMAPSDVEPASMHGASGDPLWLEIEVDAGRRAGPAPPASDWRVGLSAVIEDVDGGISYWALAHPPGKPDFHHPDSFALVLPAPEAP